MNERVISTVKKIDLTTGPVFSVIMALALPIMGSSVLQLTYNLVDMLLVGRLGSDAVASIGSSTFLIGLGYAVQASVVVGTGIKVAHAIGKQDEEEQQQYLSAGFRLNGIIGILFAIVLIFLGKPFLSFLDLQNNAVETQAYDYLLVSAPMIFFAFFNFWYVRIYNSFGQNKNALKISAIGVIINIVLDPILIYTLKLGVLGAGVATLIANATMTLLFYYQSRGLFKINLKQNIAINRYLDIIKLGLPISIQRFLFTLVNIALAKMIATFGTDAIAAQKIGLQIESITYMVIGGLNGAVTGFVGQNYGAKQFGRIQSGMKVSLITGIIYAALTTVVFNVYPNFLVSLFVSEKETVEIAAYYLKIVGLSQIFMAIEIICNGMFTGLGIPKIPATISIVFTVIRIPLAFVFIQWFGVNGIWLSIGLSSVIKGIVAFTMYILKVYRGDLNAIEAKKII